MLRVGNTERPASPSLAGMTSFAFRDRPPTPQELERLRLALSAYRDGSGQNNAAGVSQPGWRDFERVVADVLGGTNPENKAVFDVEVGHHTGRPYGISCKTSALSLTGDQVLMELSNSNAYFWARLSELSIDPKRKAVEAGIALIDLVAEWHRAESSRIDVPNSCYLVLTHDKLWSHWRLFWFSLDVLDPDPASLHWTYVPDRKTGNGGRLVAVDDDNTKWWDWYGWSGGQLKYYPPVATAIWDSGFFALEMPESPESPTDRARRYFPGLWPG